MKNSPLLGMSIILAVYVGLKYFGGEPGAMILYPVTLLVTFLHEFGHAVGAVITGGRVEFLRVNPDGSGVTGTIGGWRSIILMGGYIGSAIFGNLLFYIGAKKPRFSGYTLYALALFMGIAGFFWFETLFTTGFLLVFGFALILIVRYTNWQRWVLMFLGMASIIYIVQDFNVGPSSDLAAYSDLFVVIPVAVWMYIWLGIVLLLSFFNLRLILRSDF